MSQTTDHLGDRLPPRRSVPQRHAENPLILRLKPAGGHALAERRLGALEVTRNRGCRAKIQLHRQARDQGPAPGARRRGQRSEAIDASAVELQQDPSLEKPERAVDPLRLARGHQRGGHSLDLPRHAGERAGIPRRQRHAARELPLPELDGIRTLRNPVSLRVRASGTESPNNRSGASASKPWARFRPSVVRSVEFEWCVGALHSLKATGRQASIRNSFRVASSDSIA